MKIFVLTLIFACAIAGQAQALSVAPPPDIDNTDLHKAAEACDVKKARAVLNATPATEKPKEINRIDREGYTPLAYAAQNGCMDVVTLLVEANAVVDALKIQALENDRERMADEIRRLHEEISRLNKTLNDIRSRLGNGQVRPY